MKNEYVKPEVLVEEVLLEGMLASSTTGPEITDGPVRPLSNDRQEDRGGWGDLWN